VAWGFIFKNAVCSSKKIHDANAYCLDCCDNYWGFNPLFGDFVVFIVLGENVIANVTLRWKGLGWQSILGLDQLAFRQCLDSSAQQ